MGNKQPSDPTKITPVVEQQLKLNRQLSRQLPAATREEIAELQQHLQQAPEGTTIAAVEAVDSAQEPAEEAPRAGAAAEAPAARTAG